MKHFNGFYSVFTGEATDATQVVAADDLLEGLPHLLAPQCIDQRINHRVAHNENQVHVEVGHETDAVQVLWAGDHKDEVEKEWHPTYNEDSQKDGKSEGSFQAGPLLDGGIRTMQRCHALHMGSSQ